MAFAEEVINSETTMPSDDNDTDCIYQNDFKLSDILQKELKSKYPDVIDFISALRKFIEKQRRKIRKLKAKLKKRKATNKDVGVQTEEVSIATNSIISLSEEIKEAAEMAVQQSGFVYEETSGLYYDYNTGYYYNAELGLYYDGNTGTYMTYDQDTQTYSFHSQVDVVPNSSNNVLSPQEKKSKGSKRKQNNRNNSKGCKRERGAPGSRENSDLEEGECSDSSHNEMSEDNSDDTVLSDHTDIAKGWPPCMRIIVKTTAIPKVKEGSLYVITYEGGSLGREGDHSIVIPDINISKHHLKFSFNKESHQYLITDLGSRNGTQLNGKRISASKQESEPVEVTHGSQVQIGSTVLLCHIHPGNDTCGHCEPGLLQKEDTKEGISQPTKNEQHKTELRKLRKKFGIIASEVRNVQLPTGYTDRAQVRRQTVGSQNAHEKTQVASINESIGSENKGFKLLSKMGWSEGQSLGKEGTGVLKPVDVVSTVGTTGMGYTGNPSSKVKQPFSTKKNVWEKTQKRYQQLPSSPPLFEDLE